jgi:hypothetical protein
MLMTLALRDSVPTTRLSALKARKDALEQEIHEAALHPSLSDLDLQRLKKQKLRLKEEIEGIREAS